MRKNPWIYYGKNLLIFVVSIFLLSVIVFYIARLAPGDPLVSYYGDRAEKMTAGERAWAEEKLGLHESITVQYGKWLGRAVRADFGISYKYKMDVLEVIKGRIGNTLLLGGVGFVLIFVLALLLGIWCAWNEERLIDRAICKIGTVTSCIPEFWLSLVLILIFAVELKVLPSSGAYTIGKENDLGDRILHLILPMTVVVLGHLWYYAYLIRNKLLEEVRADYVLLAKSKGVTGKSVMFRHCVRNIIPTYLSIMAISVPHILGGTYIIEMVFSYPGIGTLSYESARYQDYNLLMVICLLSGALVILCNMIAQTINERIDPRMKGPDLTENVEVIMR
ncbi:ABC transporter permease [Dorea ammoniilytica]|uniref:ABC transporter permease n=1 Tax=Dorea ammoniilytica TaxID=2981788 RepID=A0ABT2S921_9FIRM|nr:ABC transporter permease [Dorea ammoniilytica]MCU6701033.1 ABC transporter permease [Dorea ammoniilytica]SCI14034.1 Nickel transport system permease protein nikB [uncultured Eubacterium sp.]